MVLFFFSKREAFPLRGAAGASTLELAGEGRTSCGELWAALLLPRSDQDASRTFLLRGGESGFQPGSGPEVGPGLAWGTTDPRRPRRDGGPSAAEEEEARGTLRSILPLKPDLGWGNGWMQPSAIFCDCLHQGKPSDFLSSSFFFYCNFFRRFSWNEQTTRVNVLRGKTVPQNYGWFVRPGDNLFISAQIEKEPIMILGATCRHQGQLCERIVAVRGVHTVRRHMFCNWLNDAE